MDEAEQKSAVGSIRGGLGLALAGIWIIYWWIHLDAAKKAAQAACHGEDFIGKIGKSICENNAGAGFAMEIVLVILASPIAFWIAHYVAKWWVGQKVSAEQTRRSQLEQARHQQHQATLNALGSEAQQQSNRDRDENDRHELITRLGAVDDQLIVLESETDKARITRIKLTINQSIREIDAKFTDARLQELTTVHANIRTRVERTMREMRRLGLEGSREFEDLAGMFGYGGSSEEERNQTEAQPTGLAADQEPKSA